METPWTVYSRKLPWLLSHSAACLGLCLLCLLSDNPRLVGLLTAGFGLGSFSILFLSEKGTRFNWPNLITALRLWTGLAVMLYLAFAEGGIVGPYLFLLLICIELTDFLDGFLASRSGPTPFGALWDGEIDAFFMLLLSFSATLFFRIGPWVLLIGTARYIFSFIFLFTPTIVSYPRGFKLYAKSVCAASVFTLIAATAPFLSLNIKSALLLLTLLLLSVSFLWELALSLLSRRGVPESSHG